MKCDDYFKDEDEDHFGENGHPLKGLTLDLRVYELAHDFGIGELQTKSIHKWASHFNKGLIKFKYLRAIKDLRSVLAKNIRSKDHDGFILAAAQYLVDNKDDVFHSSRHPYGPNDHEFLEDFVQTVPELFPSIIGKVLEAAPRPEGMPSHNWHITFYCSLCTYEFIADMPAYRPRIFPCPNCSCFASVDDWYRGVLVRISTLPSISQALTMNNLQKPGRSARAWREANGDFSRPSNRPLDLDQGPPNLIVTDEYNPDLELPLWLTTRDPLANVIAGFAAYEQKPDVAQYGPVVEPSHRINDETVPDASDDGVDIDDQQSDDRITTTDDDDSDEEQDLEYDFDALSLGEADDFLDIPENNF